MNLNERMPGSEAPKRLSKFKRASLFLNPFAHLATLDDAKLTTTIEILQKSFRQRTQNNIHELLEMLYKFDFFQNLLVSGESETAYNCCTYLEYVKLDKGEILFKEGDTGDNFYVILKGEIQLSQRVGTMVEAQKVANFVQDKKILEIQEEIERKK